MEKSYRGMVIQSHNPAVFSAGLDLFEMYKPDRERLELFWRSLQSMWETLYSTRLATAAAVEGNAPAGGCLIAISRFV